jgi:ADP-ribose pyrophosphatase YjhB (NUDIX family)
MKVEIICSFVPADFKKKQILISKRSATNDIYPEYWGLLGGELLEKEELKKGVRRIVKTLIGHEVETIEHLKTVLIYSDGNYDDFVVVSYVGTVENGKKITTEDNFKWITEDEINKIQIFPGIHKILRAAFKYMKNETK